MPTAIGIGISPMFQQGAVLNYPVILKDGNTVAWYKSDVASTLTKSDSSSVSLWKDYLDSGNDLANSSGITHEPYWTGGVKFNLQARWLKGAFDLVQPEMFYLVVKVNAINSPKGYLFDGNSATERGILQINNAISATNYGLFAGSVEIDSGIPYTIGEFQIIRVLFNGNATKLKVNELVSADLSCGTNAMNGLTLGGQWDAQGSAPINMEVLEIIARKTVDSSDDESDVYNYLKSKYDFYYNKMSENYSFVPDTAIDIPIEENEAMNNDTNSYGINLTASGNLSKILTLYDSICSAKVSIGVTALGTPIYKYKFGTTGQKEILLICGTNGYEQASIFTMFKLLKYIYSDNVSDSRFTGFKNMVNVTVIPCYNPDGIQAFTRGNSNLVDLYSNFPVYWGLNPDTLNPATDIYCGPSPMSELESQALAAIIPNYDIIIDFHNNGGGTTSVPQMFWVSSESGLARATATAQASAIATFFADKYASMEGVTNIALIDTLIEGTISNYALSKKKISALLEVADVNPWVGGDKYSAEICDMNEYIAFSYLNKLVTEFISTGVEVTTGLTLTAISGGVKIDWTIHKGSTEIWGKSDAGSYTLLYTKIPGVITQNDLCAPVNARAYKIRAKNGFTFSEFSEEVVIDLVPEFATVIVDGNTPAWYLSDDLTTITKDGSNYIERWNDKLASGNDLLQSTFANRPQLDADGVHFDGANDYMRAAFTLIQPEYIWLVVKQNVWNGSSYLFDGAVTAKGLLQQYGTTPQISAFAGNLSNNNSGLTVGAFSIVRVLFNGANSKLQINDNAPITGNFGADNMGGFTLGALGNNGGPCNITVKEVIIRKVSDLLPEETSIKNYLKNKYSL